MDFQGLLNVTTATRIGSEAGGDNRLHFRRTGVSFMQLLLINHKAIWLNAPCASRRWAAFVVGLRHATHWNRRLDPCTSRLVSDCHSALLLEMKNTSPTLRGILSVMAIFSPTTKLSQYSATLSRLS